jgi:hypothetical protein
MSTFKAWKDEYKQAAWQLFLLKGVSAAYEIKFINPQKKT